MEIDNSERNLQTFPPGKSKKNNHQAIISGFRNVYTVASGSIASGIVPLEFIINGIEIKERIDGGNQDQG